MAQETAPNVQISSFAVPTDADIAVFNALSDEEKRAVLLAEIEKGRASGLSERSMDDLWAEALKRAGQLPGHGL